MTRRSRSAVTRRLDFSWLAARMSTQVADNTNDRIRFHFFSDRKVEQIRARIDGLVVRRKPPDLAEVSQGTLTAERTADRKPIGPRGVCDQSGFVLPASVSLRGKQLDSTSKAPAQVTLANVPFEAKTIYYLGDLRHHNAHFGHFILETLSRAWHWGLGQPVAEPVMLGARMPGFAQQFYGLISGLAGRISLIERTTRFERVIVPAPAFVLDRYTHIQFKQLCDRIASMVVHGREPTSEQPLYLSRSRLDPDSCRMIVGEEQFERFLAERGFCIVHPERLPVAEQLRLFNRHRNIVAPMGSACHTRLFSLSDTSLHVLCPERFNPNFILCDLLNPGATHYVNVLKIPDLPQAQGLPPFATPLLLDVGKAMDALKKIGLLPSGVQFNGPLPSLEEYKARWVQIALKHCGRPDGARLRESVECMTRLRNT